MAYEEDIEVKPVLGLVKKLCEVMSEAGYVQKRGRNEKFGYDYATEADVVDMLREKLASRNVFVFPSVISSERHEHSKTSSGGTMFITDIVVKWTFLDGDTGETQECLMPGCGTDTGDKGLYKAITGSSKYLFLKAFMLPTGDDPENEKIDPKEAKAAAKAVATEKLRESAKGDETVIFTPYKEGFVALSGNGLPIVRANLNNKDMADLGFRWEGKVAMIPASKAFEFVDLCAKYNVATTMVDPPERMPESGPVRANIPEFHPPVDSGDPIIVSAKRVKGSKPGAKEFLSVEWSGKKCSCFSKTLWPHLEHYVGRPASLVVEANGQYTNVTGINTLDGVDFEEERPDLV